jgi:hypothetical protein
MTVAASVFASFEVAADDIRSRSLDTSIPAGSLSAGSGHAEPAGGPSSEDLASRIDQLEANRAASGPQTKSPISLGVSGWVSQQVTITRQ